MDATRISYHDSVKRVYERLKEDGMSNVWDRYEAQGLGSSPDTRCKFCMGGVRCDFCSNGPCRADAASDKRGVCGISADGMAMRMMLLRNVMGASTYQYHCEETIRTLREAAGGKGPFTIQEPEKLAAFKKRLGITGDIHALCDFLQEDFHRRSHEESRIVEMLAPEDRKKVWRELGIFPGGIYGEMMLATGSSLTSVDGYYVSLAKKAMRLGVAMAYQSQIVLESLQDILFGIPRPHEVKVDLGVLDPGYVNILPNGHEPFLGFALVEAARRPELQKAARDAGAKGLRIIANIETGQEMIQRWKMDDVFSGFTGNWIMQEAVLATGAVDVFVADMNCSLPMDPLYAEKYCFRLVPVSQLVAFEGEMNLIVYSEDGGTLSVRVDPDLVYVELNDTGPGIEDIDLAMTPGYSTAPEWATDLGFGAGMGLINMQRNSDRFKLHSHIGEGTRIQCWIYRQELLSSERREDP